MFEPHSHHVRRRGHKCIVWLTKYTVMPTRVVSRDGFPLSLARELAGFHKLPNQKRVASGETGAKIKQSKQRGTA